MHVTVEQALVEMTGPSRSEQWLYWKSQSVEQKYRLVTIHELEKLLQSDVVCMPFTAVCCQCFCSYWSHESWFRL